MRDLEQRVKDLREAAREQRARRDFLETRIAELRVLDKDLTTRLTHVEESMAIFLEAMKIARLHTIESVQAIVTDSLRYVFFDDPELSFLIETVERRGLEADYLVRTVKDGCEVKEHPYDCDGGSLADVVTTALQMIFLKCYRPARRPILFLDEPGKYLSPEKRTLYAEWLDKIADELDLQVIIITHDPELKAIADLTHVFSPDETGAVITTTTRA